MSQSHSATSHYARYGLEDAGPAIGTGSVGGAISGLPGAVLGLIIGILIVMILKKLSE